MVILTVLKDSISFRAAARNAFRWVTFLLDKNDTTKPKSPSHSTLERWIKRVGLFNLKKSLDKVDDLIVIFDTSITVGKSKCVIVLGISRQKCMRILKEKRALTFGDMILLDLTVAESVTGEVICGALQRSEARGGTIVQSCSDGGGENVRGIRLFRESIGALAAPALDIENSSDETLKSTNFLVPNEIYLEELKTKIVCPSFNTNRVIPHAYDVGHKLACILKSLIKEDKRWQAFTSAAAASKLKIQLTDAAHLAPPNQRSKSRYMNLEELVTWGMQGIDLVKRHVKAFKDSLNKLNNNGNDTKQELLPAQTEIKEVDNEYTREPPLDIKNVSSISWLLDHEEIIMQTSKYITVTGYVRNKLRTEGIHSNSYDEVYKECQAMEELQDSKTKEMLNIILNYIKEQAFSLKEDDVLFISSEINESLFGKLKQLMNDNLKHGLTGQVLAAAAVIGEINEEVVKQALLDISDKDVDLWTKENIGTTYTQKRRKYLGHKRKPGRKPGQKLSGTICEVSEKAS